MYRSVGTKIETSLNREVKKDTEEAPAGAPMQLRLRLHNRFNMDLNNVYAMEVIPQGKGYAQLLLEMPVQVPRVLAAKTGHG